MKKKLEGKIALVTGGTSGIGLATAKLFHAEGARIIVTGKNRATLDVARASLRGIAEVVSSDSGDAAEIEGLFARVAKGHRGLDVLFLNAGIVRGGTIAAMAEADFDEVFRVNVKGPWLALKTAIPLLRRGGAVVLNASINARLGMPGTSAYAASKAALRSFARTAASELAEQGVRVNAISLGPTDSGIIEKLGTRPRPRRPCTLRSQPRSTASFKNVLQDAKEIAMSVAKSIVETRPPVPPFTHETAELKVRLAEDGWNSRDPEKVALAYTPNSRWRNRAEFAHGRQEIIAFLTRKWARELDYRLIKEVWAFGGNRIAVRFAYEWHDDSRNWFRSYGNENWEFDENGLMRLRYACINDLPIKESDRKYHWPLGRRPDGHPGLSDLGL